VATKHSSAPRDGSARGQSRSGWVRPLGQAPLSAFRFARSRHDALIAGVAGGIGERIGVDAVLVRIAFVVLSFAGAVGVVLYLCAWFIALDPGDRRAPPAREPTAVQDISFGAIVYGCVLMLRSVGLWLGDPVGIPLLIGAGGAGVVYVGAGRERRPKWKSAALIRETPTGRPSLAHLVIGGLFVLGGVVWFLTTNRNFSGSLAVLLAVCVTVVGLAIVFGPWIYRMANQLGDERRELIRSEERAELAAHLHDSVLQTLALIQRNAGNPRKMANLARRQERELRAWLYGQAEVSGQLDAAIRDMADDIEQAHDITVETVMVGDCALDERTNAVLQACREAATNAAYHSGAEDISVYVECEPHELNAYVRDRGKGFDPDQIPNGRRGIADSILGRIRRHGGRATITSAAGEGCEVHITMPLGGDAH
jgi:phage shock protein PspC (stress-responsive transcriptional regulator)